MMCTKLTFLKTWGGLCPFSVMTLEVRSEVKLARVLDTRPNSAVAMENGFILSSVLERDSLTMRSKCCSKEEI